MRHTHATNGSRPAVPRGFTIIELIVTIGIILLLAGLSVVALGRIGGTAKEKATRGTLEKINNLVRDRMNALDRSITSGELRGQVQVKKASGLSDEVATIVVRKEEFRKAFPQSWTEVQALGIGSAASAEIARNTSSAADNSEVLYWALTNGGTYGYESVGSDAFTANEVKDTDGDENLEFVDGWEQPLRFYRWPTRLIKPGGGSFNADTTELLIDGVTTAIANSDQDDPKGKLTLLINEASFHTPNTYHVPLIVSAGPDYELGLYEPTDTTNYGHLAQPVPAAVANPGESELVDNITNRQALGNE